MSVDLPDFTSIKVVRDGAVDWLTLDRPARLNALDGAMVEELWRYFSDLQSNRDCRIVVMRGAGRGFCAGLDLTCAPARRSSSRSCMARLAAAVSILFWHRTFGLPPAAQK